MSNLGKHLKTIATHRRYVIRACAKMGILSQGLVHDLSKYSIAELKICKHYVGTKSPHQVCRDRIGYSPSWIHHYHKNKHHYQYWWDENENGKIIPMKMPFKYVIEAFCDMLGASKAYNKANWAEDKLFEYWEQHCKGKRISNAYSDYLLEKLIWNMKEMKENYFFKWYKGAKDYLKKMYDNDMLYY